MGIKANITTNKIEVASVGKQGIQGPAGASGVSLTYLVDAGGTGNYTTIQAAIDAQETAGGGFNVVILAGTYAETVTITKSVNIDTFGGVFIDDFVFPGTETASFQIARVHLVSWTDSGTAELQWRVRDIDVVRGSATPWTSGNTHTSSTVDYNDLRIETTTQDVVVQIDGNVNFDGFNLWAQRNSGSTSGKGIDLNGSGLFRDKGGSFVHGQINCVGSSAAISFIGSSLSTNGGVPYFVDDTFTGSNFILNSTITSPSGEMFKNGTNAFFGLVNSPFGTLRNNGTDISP